MIFSRFFDDLAPRPVSLALLERISALLNQLKADLPPIHLDGRQRKALGAYLIDILPASVRLIARTMRWQPGLFSGPRMNADDLEARQERADRWLGISMALRDFADRAEALYMLEQAALGREVLEFMRQLRSEAARPLASDEDDQRAWALALVERMLKRWLSGRAR